MIPLNIPLGEVLKEAREWCDWLIELPGKLIGQVEAVSATIAQRRERLRRQAELNQIRELTHILTRVYLRKGDATGWVAYLQKSGTADDLKELRFIFEEIAQAFDALAESLDEFSALGPVFGTGAAARIGRARVVYYHLSQLSDDELLKSSVLSEIFNDLGKMMDEAATLYSRVEKARHWLDHTL